MVKEIDVWVKSSEIEDNLTRIDAFQRQYLSPRAEDKCIKAKLIIEIPEPKIEVTQSMLQRMFDKHLPFKSMEELVGCKKDLFRELFGEDYEN